MLTAMNPPLPAVPHPARPDIRICALHEVREHIDWATHVVSIIQEERVRDLPPWEQAPVRVLRLVFDDVQHLDRLRRKQGTDRGPQERDVLQIIRFARELPPGARLLVHCEAGISRSGAAALTVLAALEPHTPVESLLERLARQRPEMHPNLVLVTHADRLLGRGGALVQAVEAFCRRRLELIEARLRDPDVRRRLGLQEQPDE